LGTRPYSEKTGDLLSGGRKEGEQRNCQGIGHHPKFIFYLDEPLLELTLFAVEDITKELFCPA